LIAGQPGMAMGAVGIVRPEVQSVVGPGFVAGQTLSLKCSTSGPAMLILALSSQGLPLSS
jgi:hypothetical protein